MRLKIERKIEVIAKFSDGSSRSFNNKQELWDFCRIESERIRSLIEKAEKELIYLKESSIVAQEELYDATQYKD